LNISLDSIYSRVRNFGPYFFCNCCGRHIRRFIPLSSVAGGQFVQPVNVAGALHGVDGYETLNIDAFLCPVCGSQDKARLYVAFLEASGALDLLERDPQASVLHFSPEGGLGSYLGQRLSASQYLTADIVPGLRDLTLDIRSMNSLESDHLSAFICSHVLEHVDDDEAALGELYRVLRPGGWGILQVPILLSIDADWADSTITSEEGRLKHFGLQDHVRIYSKRGFLEKVSQSGFSIAEYSVEDLAIRSPWRFGVSSSSILYVVSKAFR
jgi:SAM-dependent methyltransferase